MIVGIASGSGLQISGGAGSSPYINMSNPSAGMVRFTGSNFEVYDGHSWLIMQSSYPTIELNGEVQSLLNWARMKKQQEEERDRLAKSSPAIRDLIKQIEEKEEQIKIVQALIKEETKVGTN